MGGTLGGTMPVTLQHIRITDGDRAEMDGTLYEVASHSLQGPSAPTVCASRTAYRWKLVRTSVLCNTLSRRITAPSRAGAGDDCCPVRCGGQKGGHSPVWGPKHSSAAGLGSTAWRFHSRRGMQLAWSAGPQRHAAPTPSAETPPDNIFGNENCPEYTARIRRMRRTGTSVGSVIQCHHRCRRFGGGHLLGFVGAWPGCLRVGEMRRNVLGHGASGEPCGPTCK